MANGIKIPASLFKTVTDALEGVGIEYDVFNVECLIESSIDPNYNGMIELECYTRHWERFKEIVQDILLKEEEMKKSVVLFNDLLTFSDGDHENDAMTLNLFDASTIVLMIRDEKFRNEVLARWEKENELED